MPTLKCDTMPRTLRQPDWRRRSRPTIRSSVIALRRRWPIADPSTTSAIIGILSSPDAELRKDAVEALGKIKSAPAVQAITKALNDRDPEVRKAAAEALGEIDEG